MVQTAGTGDQGDGDSAGCWQHTRGKRPRGPLLTWAGRREAQGYVWAEAGPWAAGHLEGQHEGLEGALGGTDRVSGSQRAGGSEPWGQMLRGWSCEDYEARTFDLAIREPRGHSAGQVSMERLRQRPEAEGWDGGTRGELLTRGA